jgi:molybdopterin converting factor subunit 1
MDRGAVRIKVLLFARLRELAGAELLDLDLAEGSTVGDVWRQIQGTHPALAAYRLAPLAAVNLDYAALDTPVAVGVEVAFFPPVSGG